ncbi:RagB/SusD family nutrient uptake outer membrane protein [Pedobacter sp. JY14-1]|uniref:RagB/SusD family nutrient uptake outer membrane protein n=1 Tax=Pedobacter sp. JY14-1 TaxID=3034151 RepID=UPI0023E27219|nr:RagB/SusD family nutrient uptake outer membrane protein [Pedobacter sp. JY14-1]
MKKLNTIILILAAISLGSCKKYLDKPNKIQTDIETVDQLRALLDNVIGEEGDTYSFNPPVAFGYEGHNATATYSTDDTEISTDFYKANPNAVLLANLYYYVFDVDNIVGASTDPLWNNEFRKIFNANVVLANIDNVRGDEVIRKQVKADAYFIRAYSYWTLVNYYCLPYSEANLQSKGLPLKRTTDYAESLQRANLRDTYSFILEDIRQAQSLVNYQDVPATFRWRVSKPAIDAFLSRYYLFTGEYAKSVDHSNSALISQTAKLVDFNTIPPGNSANYSNPSAILRYSALNDYGPTTYFAWDEFFYTRFTTATSQWFIPSTSLLALYDRNEDLRYRLLMIENGGRRANVITPAQYRYTYFDDGSYLPAGPTVAEVLLNKAEALARKGDVADALNAANTLRAKRLKTYTALTAGSAEEALTQVLRERRRELPFSFRWFDIRRFSVNETPGDDVTITRTFFKVGTGSVDLNTVQTYTLPVKSLRYAIPINGVEISAGRGQIEQNNY